MSHEWKTAMVEGPVTRAEKAEAENERLRVAIAKALDFLEVDGDYRAAALVLNRAEEGS